MKDIAAEFDNRPEMLVQILVRIVQRHGWVSEDTIRQLADILNLSAPLAARGCSARSG